MPKSIKPIELKHLKTHSLNERQSKVSAADFAKTWPKGAAFKVFLASLPNILAGHEIRSAIRAIAAAYQQHKPVVFGIGAHVIKVGLNPVMIDMMERGVISGVALNGAGIIHDVELALQGKTSEDVDSALGDGSFGMAHETSTILNEAIRDTCESSTGLGEAIGKFITARKLSFLPLSILAAGYRLGIPCTVHIALGTDIIHMHPEFDAAAAGSASHRDFRIFAAMIAELEGGVYVNVGSAVILPEVFLKAVTLVRNLGHPLQNFTTLNLDFIRQYRPITNVVTRPTAKGGRGFHLTGHHEIMLPLIAAGIIEEIDDQ